MSFGSRRLDEAYDRWATQTPEEAGYYEEEEKEEKKEWFILKDLVH